MLHLTRIFGATVAVAASALLLAGCTLGNGLTKAEAEQQLADVTCALPDHPTLSEEAVSNYEAFNTRLQESTIDDPQMKKNVNDAAISLREMVGNPIDETWNNNLKLACQISQDVASGKFDDTNGDNSSVPDDVTDTSTPAAPSTDAPSDTPAPAATDGGVSQ